MRDVGDFVNLAVERGRRALEPQNRPERCPERFVFVTVSGAHLYGFPSPDSDIDLRGAHILPLRAIIGLRPPEETVEIQGASIDGVELDCSLKS